MCLQQIAKPQNVNTERIAIRRLKLLAHTYDGADEHRAHRDEDDGNWRFALHAIRDIQKADVALLNVKGRRRVPRQ